MNLFKKKEFEQHIPLGLKNYNPDRVKFAFNALLSIGEMLPRGKAHAVDIQYLMSRSGIHMYENGLCYDIMQELVRMCIYSYDKKLQVYYVEDR